ncbi:MAG: class I SAM-dependent methyltransferase [Sphingobacteriales bacterium]|nr:MAG: class I SAM-dependent methyltransferase [Sphingobacteriales bacterium]
MQTTKNLEDCWFPLGEFLYDYYHGELAAQITIKSNIEEDRFIPAGTFFREKNRFPRLEKMALKNCKGCVLDVGAGAGSHALFLQNKGLEVDALDISSKAVKVMQARGIKNAFADDIFDFKPAEKYDTVLMMMNGIGLAGDLDGLEKLLHHLKTLLKPNGQIIFDTTDIAYVDEKSRARSSILDYKPAYYGTVYYQLFYKGQNSEVYPWLYVDKDTLQRIALACGYWMDILTTDDDQYLVRLTVS